MRTSRWLVVLAVGLAPAATPGQTVTRVRIAQSATGKVVDSACTAETTRFTAASDDAADTLRIRIEDDLNQPAPALDTVWIAVAALRDSLAKDLNARDYAVKPAKSLVGSALRITRRPTGTLVCAIVIPAPRSPARTGSDTLRAYRVGVGANFDFLNGVSATDLYSDLNVFLPSIWGGDKQGAFGLDGGMYNGRTAARRDTSGPRAARPDTLRVRRVVIIPRAARDSVMRIVQTIERRDELSFDKLGLFLAPTYRLRRDLYLTLHSEVIKREAISKVTIKVTAADTTMEPDTLGPRRPISPGGRAPGDTSFTRRVTEYESFFGLGPIVSHTISKVNFHSKTLVGVGAVDGVFKSYYAVQFRIADYENGFKLGGEVRGRLNLRAPVVLVYLAKDFGLKRFADFLVGGDDDAGQ